MFSLRTRRLHASVPWFPVAALLVSLTVSSPTRASDEASREPNPGVASPVAVVPAAVVPGADTAAAPAPPSATDSSASSASASAAADELEVQHVVTIGDARWSDNLGFVRAGTPPPDAGTTAGAPAAPKVGSLSLNLGTIRFGAGRARLNATNDGLTADDTAFYVLDLPLDVRFEWRNPGSLLALWLDFGAGAMFGKRTLVDAAGNETDDSLTMTGVRLQALVGLDVHPFEYIGVGPLAGAHVEFYDATLQQGTGNSAVTSTSIPDGGFAPDLGPVLGAHARLRTKARPGKPSLLYVDPAFTWRLGSFQTAQYASVEAGLRAGGVYFVGWYEQRVSASGHFTYSVDGSQDADAKNLSEAFAASMPVDRRFGLALAVIFDGT